MVIILIGRAEKTRACALIRVRPSNLDPTSASNVDPRSSGGLVQACRARLREGSAATTCTRRKESYHFLRPAMASFGGLSSTTGNPLSNDDGWQRSEVTGRRAHSDPLPFGHRNPQV